MKFVQNRYSNTYSYSQQAMETVFSLNIQFFSYKIYFIIQIYTYIFKKSSLRKNYIFHTISPFLPLKITLSIQRMHFI